ncbi:MAG: HAD-superfamily subfamily hydrolase [Pseudonocardiales bacterium]|nr:HAD-superfamily subfamily hydrolase [Pseudonocardiales bacterium]
MENQGAVDGAGDTLAVEPLSDAAAFFDVDNTIMIGASMFHFAKGLAARKFFSSRDLAGFVWKQVRFRLGGEKADDIASARESALAFVAGKHIDELVAIGSDIYDSDMADRIWPGTRALAQAHLDAGERVWLVTATPEELAQIIADRLGLTGALGTRAEKTPDGVYTGHLVDHVLHGEAKAAAVRALALREGLDLSRCAAYSDSINDLPMLSLVGRAVAVNPDSALRSEAKRRGWEISDFRTGRKAAMIGVPSFAGTLAIGGVVFWVIIHRRRQAQPHPAWAAVGRISDASAAITARANAITARANAITAGANAISARARSVAAAAGTRFPG